MDPVQLQLMQQMGMMSSQMGLPGFYYPGVSGGVSSLSAFARDPNYGSPIRGGAYPDISPLAPLNLQNYGLLGTMASIAGNTYMTSMFQQNGILPMGNAGSFMQAQRANQYMQMQRSVAQEVAPQDADSYYQTIKGMAALTGQPFNREQREAARNLANTMAEFGPNIAMFRPDILDAIAGETGSVQAMASQMMEANRYRVDPYTGQIGYGKDANADLIKSLFDTLYSKDSMAQMNGLRAGEAGQLYRELADRGLITQEDGGLRERTITALEKARSSGRLAEIGDEAGVDVSGDLEKLNFEELDKLRQTSGVRKLLTDADVDNIRRQLRGYSDSIAAIREVFGENGNPNAPIPELIGALEALTSGQMHKFDAAKLNLMVRDMQSLSQMSGKSIDQMLAMNQGNTSYLQQMGLGNHAAVFAPDATNVGVAHGMAFAEQGGATGFGALNRAQAEQAASRMFARGMASEAGNMYATLGRINAAGGFDENTEAGRKLKAIHDAAVNGQSTYVDPTTGQETALPTRESEVRRLIGQGGAVGVGLEDFNIMLGQRTSNLRIQAEDKRYASIPMNLQAEELRRVSERDAANVTYTAAPLQDLDPNTRNEAARRISTAARGALDTLSPQERQDRELRQRTMAEAVKREALNNGVTLTDAEASAMAENIYGSFENTAVNKFGFESETAASQVMGPQVTEARTQKMQQAKARSQMNQAMSELGPKGTITQRVFSAIQNQGERGKDADLDTFLIDMFGVENLEAREKIVPELQAIANEKQAIEKLSLQLEDPNLSAEERANTSREIEKRTEALRQRNIEIRNTAREFGFDSGEGRFGKDDVKEAEDAARNLEQLNRLDQARILSDDRPVSQAERDATADRRITQEDVIAIAERRRKLDIKQIGRLTAEDIETYSTKVEEIEKLQERLDTGGVDEGWFDVTGIDPDDREAMQEEIDRRKFELGGMTPELQQKYTELKRQYGEETAVRMIKDRLVQQVGTAEERAVEVADEFGNVITTVGQLTQEDQDAVVRSRRADKAVVPTADQIAERAAELRADLGLTEEELSTKELSDQLSASNRFDAGLSRIKEAVNNVVNKESSLVPSTAIPAEAVREALGNLSEDLTEDQKEIVTQSVEDILKDSSLRDLKNEEVREKFVTQVLESAEENGLQLTDEQQTAVRERIDTTLKKAAEDEKAAKDRQKDLADDLSSEAVNTLLSLAPEELADKEDRVVAITDALVERAKEKGIELSREDATTYAENALQEAERVAKEYGFESVEDFVNKAPVTSADELRKEISRREELAGDQATLARSQLLAESQLQAMGQLAEGEKLNASAEEILKFKNMDEGLKKQLAEASVEERHELVAKWVDGRVNEQFYGTEEQREESRQRAIRELQSPEGERRIEEIRDNFETMTDLRRELVLDPKAVSRLGAAKAEKAIKQSRDAEMKLQEMANRYGFNGSVEAMLASDFVGSDPEVIEQEFADLDQEQKQQVVERLEAEGITVKADELSVSDYQSYLRYQMKDQMNELEAANRTMRGATDDKERAKELGVTEKQVKPLEELARMEQTIAEDAEKAAKTLGISEESYRNMVKGTEEFDESLKLFKGDDAAEQLAAAKKSEAVVADRQRQLDAVNENIQSIEESGGTVAATTLNRRKELEQEIATERQARDRRMRDAGLDPNKEEDVKRYNTLLNAQGDVSTLETRRKEYMEKREKLKAEGKSDAEIDAHIDQLVTANKAAQERFAEFQKQDITPADLQLAEAFGIDTSESNERLTEFKQMLKDSGGTSEASKRTQKMLADTLEEVDKLKGLEGDTAIEKLDKLTDEYHAASPAERKALAHKYGIDEKDLDSMMRRTDFMGLENVDMSKMSDKEREKTVGESLKRTMGKDIEAEVKAEEERQLKLTGTVNVTGVIQGEGTFEDVTGNTVR